MSQSYEATATADRGRKTCRISSWSRWKGHTLCVVHALESLSLDLRAAGVRAVIFGHSHIPHNESRDGILYFNPGSAGPPRFGKPISMGKLYVDADGLRGELIPLCSAPKQP